MALRDLVSRVSADDAALLAYGRAMVLWHRRHRHCGHCGARTIAAAGGFALDCSSPACGERTFPRLDPAIIVLVHRGDHCLLGRQRSWPEGRFSTLAGYVEPGESLEEAVAREVREETDVVVGDCRYLASQPWPFPASLMLGFHASARSSAIRLNDGELAEARWLSREDVGRGVVTLPPATSIAFHLIARWVEADGGAPLAQRLARNTVAAATMGNFSGGGQH
jgi:NAD+ diphosphatase